MWLTVVEGEGHGLVADEKLSAEEQGDEFLLMGLRLAEGIDAGALRGSGRADARPKPHRQPDRGRARRAQFGRPPPRHPRRLSGARRRGGGSGGLACRSQCKGETAASRGACICRRRASGGRAGDGALSFWSVVSRSAAWRSAWRCWPIGPRTCSRPCTSAGRCRPSCSPRSASRWRPSSPASSFPNASGSGIPQVIAAHGLGRSRRARPARVATGGGRQGPAPAARARLRRLLGPGRADRAGRRLGHVRARAPCAAPPARPAHRRDRRPALRPPSTRRSRASSSASRK